MCSASHLIQKSLAGPFSIFKSVSFISGFFTKDVKAEFRGVSLVAGNFYVTEKFLFDLSILLGKFNISWPTTIKKFLCRSVPRGVSQLSLDCVLLFKVGFSYHRGGSVNLDRSA